MAFPTDINLKEINSLNHIRLVLTKLINWLKVEGGGGGGEGSSEIYKLIPSQASETNKLADKEFVNSSIATNTANFKGTVSSVADLANITSADNNDYAFVISTDSDGNTVYNRYKYNGTQWTFEYALNNSSFTAEQWAAINSGINATIANQIVKSTAIRNIVVLTQSDYDALEEKDSNTEYNIIEE